MTKKSDNKKLGEKTRHILLTLEGLKTSEMLSVLLQAANTVIQKSECEALTAKPTLFHETVSLRLSKIETHPEIKQFVDSHIGKIRQKDIIKQVEERFGKKAISKAGLSRYVRKYRARQIKQNASLGRTD